MYDYITGRRWDATASIPERCSAQHRILLHARTPRLNADYAHGLRLILREIALNRGYIEQIEVVSRDLKERHARDRRIKLPIRNEANVCAYDNWLFGRWFDDRAQARFVASLDSRSGPAPLLAHELALMEFDKLRRQIMTMVAAHGRLKGARGSGNPAKRICIHYELTEGSINWDRILRGQQ